ncbi:rhamnosyltransferase [Mucilaginibacter sp. OK268]|uniref:glycosyltransferase n=1 Tax=Mucilaginibacter sp. OK268 TaxID=1881048 RepID=UPI0008810AEE|nr:glycosyltransferase [Mucilaginibacter sp. OK268]SDP56854.1 rhamnosyltransferase [Mucilaginibacter sp. OK268]
MRLSAIIVIYQPEITELIKNIAGVINAVDQLILYQNSSIADQLIFYEAYLNLPHKDKITFLGTGDNVGIATALNMGVKWSLENDYTHILTLDQDSYFEPGVLTSYKLLISQQNDDRIGVFGINPVCGNSFLFEVADQVLEVTDTITSGSIFPLNIFNECGLFMDELFIDAVDYEFCYRISKRNGYKTLVFTSILLQHKVGYVTKTRWGFKTDNYSAFRTYFIVRNHIIMWKRYPEIFPRTYKIVLIKTHIIGRIIKVFLAENDKQKKTKAIIIGLIHGLKGRLGYYNVN